MATLTSEEVQRYKRHLVLRDVGAPGQQKLKGARVLVIGAGGLGSPVVAYLAAAGVGTIGIVDDDRVSIDNLQRQIAHRTEDADRLRMVKVRHRLPSVGVVAEPLSAGSRRPPAVPSSRCSRPACADAGCPPA